MCLHISANVQIMLAICLNYYLLIDLSRYLFTYSIIFICFACSFIEAYLIFRYWQNPLFRPVLASSPVRYPSMRSLPRRRTRPWQLFSWKSTNDPLSSMNVSVVKTSLFIQEVYTVECALFDNLVYADVRSSISTVTLQIRARHFHKQGPRAA